MPCVISIDYSSIEITLSVVIIVGATAASIYLIANDVTGVGVADDAALGVLAPIIWDNVAKLITA